MLGITTTDQAGELSDEEILTRSQAEPWLFAVLLDRYQDAFLRKARTIVYNQLDVEEVVQDTFTKIYRNAHQFEVREGASFRSWAYQILFTTACTRYQKCRKEKDRFQPINPEYEHLVVDTQASDGTKGRKDAVERVLARLPKQFGLVLRRHYLERWSHKDIAAAEGSTEGAVKAKVYRAKKAFRRATKDKELRSLFEE